MIIIFEGIVDSGKSTLIKGIRESCTTPLWTRRETFQTISNWNEYLRQTRDTCMHMYKTLHGSGQHVNMIHDRFHVSTGIQLNDSVESILKTSDELSDIGSFLVYTYCSDLNVLRSRLKDRNKDLDVETLHCQFENIIGQIELSSNLRVVRCDTSKLNPTECVDRVMRHMYE